jgi:hypothetical protein
MKFNRICCDKHRWLFINDLVSGRHPFKILTALLVILTEEFYGFTKFIQADARIVL